VSGLRKRPPASPASRYLLGKFSEVDGLFTVLICIPCLEVRQAQPGTLLGLHDPGQPWEKWVVQSTAAAAGSTAPGPGGHTAAEHPGWTATYELVRPYPNQHQRVVFRRVEDPAG
jgi:hypothetical protein